MGVQAIKYAALLWEWTARLAEFLDGLVAVVELQFGQKMEEILYSYYKDMEQRLKQTTVRNKHAMIDGKIAPYFAKLPLDSI